MRVAFFAGQFPSLSTTFILNQITGLIDRGVDVEVFSAEGTSSVEHEDVVRYQLASHIHHWPSVNRGWTVVRDVLVSEGAAALARTIRNSLRSRQRGLGVKASLRALTVLDQGNFDVMVAHFGPVGVEAQQIRARVGINTPLVTFFHGSVPRRNELSKPWLDGWWC